MPKVEPGGTARGLIFIEIRPYFIRRCDSALRLHHGVTYNSNVNFKSGLALVAGVSAGLFGYGMLVEANRLVVVHKSIKLPRWPSRLNGFKIAVLGDFHLRDEYSSALAKRAVDAVLDEQPDMVALVGDIIDYWKPEVIPMIGDVLEDLLLLQGAVVAIPGNHEYRCGNPDLMESILNELNIKYLRNSSWDHAGIQWVGVDSANAGQSDPITAFEKINPDEPCITLWHEPDMVEWLPARTDLMLSGHSHGGQFLTPWGKPFTGSRNGRKYLRGFYDLDPNPLYVTSGVGTTGPPSRLFCPPEVVILTLRSA